MQQVPFERTLRSKFLHFSTIALVWALSSGCMPRPFDFNIASQAESFSQVGFDYNAKVDILWVVDGSSTMAVHQNNLANNFGVFISEFASKGFDYQMAVSSTDAWVRELDYNPTICAQPSNPSKNPATIYTCSADCTPTAATFGELAAFRDGDIYGGAGATPGVRTGEYLLSGRMGLATVLSLFSTNIKVGVRGDGSRESAFQSLRAVLRRDENGLPAYDGETHTVLNQFRRPDAFLAVIIVSDEDDQSRRPNGAAYADVNDYVTNFKTFMDGYTAGAPYSVSSIVVDNIANCSVLNPEAKQGDRYVAAAHAMNGVVGNICQSNFSAQLSEIARQVVTLLTRFPLSREPSVSTISVVINGNSIPQSATNGWTYGAENGKFYLSFHGSAVPPQGAQIHVDYVPTSPR
ncbi:MAG: hypothetical protein KF802_03020 [Bdellovibrionaceae bacterium]|nr:hypothetical protein [Pseudobdellovibrionaceae bacterium]